LNEPFCFVIDSPPCHRCFSIIDRKQKENGLVFREFEAHSSELEIHVADLLENFMQLLGDSAKMTKMTDKEMKERMEWVQNSALLPFPKYCMWCLAMKRELASAPAPKVEEEFHFLDLQRSFLKQKCICNQCQLGDVAQLADKSSGCWSCIRNSRREKKDIVVSFNLLEQHVAAGAPVEFTFCCLSGAAYNYHHDPGRLFRLLCTQRLELRELLSRISETPLFESRIFIVRHWLVSHNLTTEQLYQLLLVGGSCRWKAELLVVAVNRLTCPVSDLSKCLSSILTSLPGEKRIPEFL
jgi:hypothetical protein